MYFLGLLSISLLTIIINNRVDINSFTFQLHSTATVSYTHLDVYKRQVVHSVTVPKNVVRRFDVYRYSHD